MSPISIQTDTEGPSAAGWRAKEFSDEASSASLQSVVLALRGRLDFQDHQVG